MRPIACILFLVICFNAIAQSEFEIQLKGLIKDSVNRFRNHQGNYKRHTQYDSTYSSISNLPGTKENEIQFSIDSSVYVMDSYWANIADSVSFNEGEKMRMEWADKLRQLLGNEYSQKINLKKGEMKGEYSVEFERGYFSIAIVHMAKQRRIPGRVFLHISYVHLQNEK